jgi:hypothetical protein
MSESSSKSLVKIKKKLNKILSRKLPEVSDFVEFLVKKYSRSDKNVVKFEGIWQSIGFENLTNLESKIRQLRKETNDSLLNRVEKWNI